MTPNVASVKGKSQGRGALYGIASATLFGASTPLAKRLLPQFHPVFLAGLLYAGAAVGLAIARLAGTGGTGRVLMTSQADRWRLLGVVVFGGICGPVLLMIGLSRVSGVAGSLLLNLEGVWTALLAILVFGDRVTPREGVAISVVLMAAVLVSYESGAIAARATGVAAIACACLCWGLDNNLMQRLSGADPVRLVLVKSSVAGPVNLALGWWLLPATAAPSAIAAALVLGVFSYGVSIVFDVLALRHLGAAREAALFATAPFVGAALAIPVLGESIGATQAVGGAMMAIGVLLLLRSART